VNTLVLTLSKQDISLEMLGSKLSIINNYNYLSLGSLFIPEYNDNVEIPYDIQGLCKLIKDSNTIILVYKSHLLSLSSFFLNVCEWLHDYDSNLFDSKKIISINDGQSNDEVFNLVLSKLGSKGILNINVSTIEDLDAKINLINETIQTI